MGRTLTELVHFGNRCALEAVNSPRLVRSAFLRRSLSRYTHTHTRDAGGCLRYRGSVPRPTSHRRCVLPNPISTNSPADGLRSQLSTSKNSLSSTPQIQPVQPTSSRTATTLNPNSTVRQTTTPTNAVVRSVDSVTVVANSDPTIVPPTVVATNTAFARRGCSHAFQSVRITFLRTSIISTFEP